MLLLNLAYDPREEKSASVTFSKMVTETQDRINERDCDPDGHERGCANWCWLCRIHIILPPESGESLKCILGNRRGFVESSDCLLLYFLTDMFKGEVEFMAGEFGKDKDNLTMRDFTKRFLYK